jgi:hypothetical protein
MYNIINGEYEIEKGHKCFIVFEYETIEHEGFPINSKGFATLQEAKRFVRKMLKSKN